MKDKTLSRMAEAVQGEGLFLYEAHYKFTYLLHEDGLRRKANLKE